MIHAIFYILSEISTNFNLFNLGVGVLIAIYNPITTLIRFEH